MTKDMRFMPKYSDGTYVSAGDTIRYHQAPGGILAPGAWKYGTAVDYEVFGGPSLVLLANDGYRYNLYSHVIERAEGS